MKKKVARGVIWTAIENGGVRGITFVVFLVLARLLDVEDFGLVALATVFVAFLELVVRVGITDVMVQRKYLSELDKNTAFWIGAILGVASYVLSVFLAPFVAQWTRQDEMTLLVQWLALGILPISFTRVQEGLLIREMEFKKLAFRRMLATVAGAFVGITMALRGYGVWSLVGQQLTDRFVDFITLYWVTKWFPRWKFSITSLKEMGSYSTKVMATNIIYFINSQADRLIIGQLLGAGSLGIYVVGRRLAEVLLNIVSNLFTRVSFSAFSKLQDDMERSQNVYLKASRIASLVSVPLFTFLILEGGGITEVLFGSKWESAGLIAQLVAVSALFKAMLIFSTPLLKALGYPGSVLRAVVIQAVVGPCFSFLAYPYGLIAVAGVWIIGEMLVPFILVYSVSKLINIDRKKIFHALWPALLAAGTSGGALVVLKVLFPQLETSTLSILVHAVAFVLVYLVVLLRVAPSTYFELSRWLRGDSRI